VASSNAVAARVGFPGVSAVECTGILWKRSSRCLAKINELKLPVFVHPMTGTIFPAYDILLDHYIGWPVDTAVSIAR
jgi:hypothetical protein